MEELIRRSDAIKAFCMDCKGQGEPCEHSDTCKTMKVLRSRKKIPAVEPKREWIPCSEKLPKEETHVLVNVCVDEAPWSIIVAPGNLIKEYYERGYINAWMPLPEPWKGADDK